MKVTVDGAGLNVTLARYGRGTVVRGNLIHDTQWNAFGRGEVASGILDTIPCHGLYLDGNNTGCQYVDNVVHRNAGGPLLFNSHTSRNRWGDNLMQQDGTPPREFMETTQAWAGLDATHQRSILKTQPNPCDCYSTEPTRPVVFVGATVPNAAMKPARSLAQTPVALLAMLLATSSILAAYTHSQWRNQW